MKQFLLAAIAASLTIPLQTTAATYDVLWFDSTPTYGSQAPDSFREEMSDFLDTYSSGDVFDATYVSGETAGTLAAELASSTYDVIIFDSTTAGLKFNDDDLAAVESFYSSGKKNLMFDGSLYIRNIDFSSETDFPGPGGAMGGLLVNQATAIAERGGGILVGTDHNCCQTDANQIVDTLLPGAGFSGLTVPSTDGVFYGDLLLNGAEAIAAADVLDHWNAVPSQGIAPTGMFNDFLGDEVELFSFVDVADVPGGGPKFSYISASFAPGSGTTDVDDDTVGGSGGGGGVSPVPLPANAFLLLSALGLAGFGARFKKRTAA